MSKSLLEFIKEEIAGQRIVVFYRETGITRSGLPLLFRDAEMTRIGLRDTTETGDLVEVVKMNKAKVEALVKTSVGAHMRRKERIPCNSKDS